MKTIEQLEQGFIDDIIKLNCRSHKEFFAAYTGDIVKDFSEFTKLQSGGKSDNKSDSARFFSPKTPDIDGHFYHTVDDVTFQTYKKFFPNNTDKQFYNMTSAERTLCVKWFITAGRLTSSELVNILISYIIWGGSLGMVLKYYASWYPDKGIVNDAFTDAYGTFIKLIDVRRYVYGNKLKGSIVNKLGWDRGILNFYRIFKQYK
jgi:hypothetical protein